MLTRWMPIRMAALALLTVAAACAADVSGKWTGQMNGPDGDMTMTATFKQDGTKLTGTMDGPGGQAMEIQDGKVEGDKIVFSVAFNDMKVVHEGTIKGDEITINIKMDGGDGPGPIKLKRVKQ